MILLVAIIAIHILASTRRQPFDGQWARDEFLSPRGTTIVNGIFVLLIFLSHASQYLDLKSIPAEAGYLAFRHLHHQWVVTTFLAFSGFGVMTSLMRGGAAYVRRYPRNRLLKTLLGFDLAVALYLLVDLSLGRLYPASEIALALIGYTSVGNSNWYIFTILVLYTASWLAALTCRDNHRAVALVVTLATAAYVEGGCAAGLRPLFVSTAMTYPAGMWLALYKDRVWELFRGRPTLSLALILTPIVVTYQLRGNPHIMNVSSVFFVLFIVWLMAHLRLSSPALSFFGRHAFSIYVLQRIPMMVLDAWLAPTGYLSYVFVVASFVLTLALAHAFDRALVALNRLICV